MSSKDASDLKSLENKLLLELKNIKNYIFKNKKIKKLPIKWIKIKIIKHLKPM